MFRNTAWVPLFSGLLLLASGCGGDNSGSGAFYVETCSLGCSNGLGGTQVSCGVVKVAENQDLALLFSSRVNLATVNKQSFAIFNVTTGAVPAGSFLVDPLNFNRLIFRPKLSFDENGNPVFGFKKDASYKIRIAGTSQGDPPPYVKSSGGRANEARVLCTITTSGIVDPIPGPPSATIFVDEEDPVTGAITSVALVQNQIPGATNIATDSNITFEFDELMNIGTLLVPTTGQSPFIQVSLDTDGDLNTVVDRSPIDGLYSYSIDVGAQTTTLRFDPTDGFPSSGANPAQPRLVVIDLPAAVTDIAGNGLANPGLYNFAPKAIVYPLRTLPEGGEDFGDETRRDPKRTGADWGSAVTNRLTPGEGGGSGRLGDLIVKGGETRVVATSQTSASATAQFLSNPMDGDLFQIAGVIFTFKDTPTLSTEVQIQANVPYTVATLADALNAYALANPGSGVDKCTFWQTNFNTLLVTANDPGPDGNALTINAIPAGLAALSGATLAGGSDGETFSSPDTITNFDFQAQPGTIPPDVLVGDGVFEFTYVDVEPNAAVVLIGDNAARMLVRGDLRLQANGSIDAAGEDRGLHGSDTPYGQMAGAPGPSAGRGGRGGDRSNVTDSGLQSAGGIALGNSVLDGDAALGVGANPALGPGRGGRHWPDLYPTTLALYGDVAVEETQCESHQMAGAGSGGGYATDGGRGVARTDVSQGVNEAGSTVCNLPPGGAPPCPAAHLTASGTAASVGLEPPSLNPTAERLLTPALGFLRGGSGGGGGGGHLFGTSTAGFPGCFGFGFNAFVDSSAAAGGGGGGGLQLQVGDDAIVAGVIDAGGGRGGSADNDPINGVVAAPGGGGSGGAILLEAGQLDLAASAGRLVVAGGDGGTGVASSVGGAGGTGVTRVEQRGGGLVQTTIALAVDPIDPGDPLSTKWLSVGEWTYDPNPNVTTTEEGFSGAESCWLDTPDGAFSLTFLEDAAAPAAPADMGWNMDVILDLGNPGDPQAYPFRGTDGLGPYGGLYPEEQWGQLLNRELMPGEDPAPIVVRFQGAKTVAAIPDLCNVDVTSPLSGIQAGSLSPWVPAPTDLNSFFPLADIVRWVILFDGTAPFASEVLGVTNVRIEVQPE